MWPSRSPPPGGELLLETGGGFFRPGSHASGGQLPGTCSSYYTMQRAASLSAADGVERCSGSRWTRRW